MPHQYLVKPIRDVVAEKIKTSAINGRIRDKHLPFLPNWQPEMAEDWRNDIAYKFGPTVSEPGIAERWQKFEDKYRRAERIYDFWQVVLSNVTVDPHFLSIVGDDFVVQESYRLSKELRAVFPDVSEAELRAVRYRTDLSFATDVALSPAETIDEAALLGTGMYANYFNWTLRYASRLRLFERFPKRVKLLVPSTKIGYIRSTLQFFGVNLERVVSVDKPIKVQKLHVLAPLAYGRYELSPQMLINVREHPKVLALPDTGKRRIYIPRVNVRMRQVINEDAILAMLNEFGFESFDNGAHSVEQQATAFHSADLIVAPHGAGLSNIVYAKAGSTVVEIIPEGYDQGVTSYRSLADLYRLRYIPVFAREVQLDPKGNRCNSDIEVDVSELKALIAGLVSQPD